MEAAESPKSCISLDLCPCLDYSIILAIHIQPLPFWLPCLLMPCMAFLLNNLLVAVQSTSGMCFLPLSSIYCDRSCGRCNPAPVQAEGSAQPATSAGVIEGVQESGLPQQATDILGASFAVPRGSSSGPAESFVSTFGPLVSSDSPEVEESLK